MRISLLILTVSLAACKPQLVIPELPPPVDAQCARECFEPCKSGVLWQPEDPESPAAWNQLIEQVVIPDRTNLAICDQRRYACVTCIERLRKAGVIK